MSKKVFTIILVPLLFGALSTAQEEKDSKHSQSHHYDITVTANLIETPVQQTASSVTVITREEIENSKKSTLLDVLEGITGITTTQAGSTGAAATVSIRGAGAEHTKILLDGIEINDPITPNRTLDLSLFLLDNIERIEILRGPQSTLYGSDAMAGVINIITKKDSSSPNLSLTTGAGSYGEIRAGAAFSRSTQKMNFALSASFLQAEGLSAASSNYTGNMERDGTQNQNFQGRFSFKPSVNTSFYLSSHMIFSKTDIDNFGGPYGDDPNNLQEYQAYILGGGFRTLLLKNRWEQILDISLIRYQRSYDNPPDPFHAFESDRSDYSSRILKLEWRNNLYLHENNTLILGASVQQETGESEYHSQGFWETHTVFPQRKAGTASLFIQDVIRTKEIFFASVGIRWDRHSQFGDSFTFRIAPALLIKKTGTKIKGTYGTAFKAPSLYQLYAPPLWGPLGNKDLNPERSRGWDAGFEQTFLSGRLVFEAVYFQNDFSNLIQWAWLQGFINISSAKTHGAEFDMQTQPFKDFSLHVSYTRTNARDLDSHIPLLRRPKDKLTARISFDFLERGHLTASYILFGEREDLFFTGSLSERVIMPAFSLINAALSFSLRKGFQIYVRVHNILNTEYEWIKGYGTRGFSIQGGIQLQLD